jgi:hypothetical protein
VTDAHLSLFAVSPAQGRLLQSTQEAAAPVKPVVSIIIVSYNVRDVLRDCLRSLDDNPPSHPYEIIVVDSASSDGTAEMVSSEFPDVRLLAQAENVGFSRGNNIGIEASQGEFLFLLNPDTLMLAGCTDRLIDVLQSDAQAGLCGPQTLNADRSIQSSRRRFPTFWSSLFESTVLQPIAPRRVLRHFYASDLPDDEVSQVDWVQGSALLARRAVYEAIGGLDEGFFMYSEELDWCRRAAVSGWKCLYVGTAQLVHLGGQSSQQAPASTHINFQRSKLRYMKKYHGPLQAQMLRLCLLANYAWMLSIEQAKRMLGHKTDMRRDRVRTYWQVLRSGLQVT